MVVEVILREVGEDSGTDAGAIEPVLGNADGRSLDGALRGPRLQHVAKCLLQTNRIRCGHARADELRPQAHTQSAHHTALLAWLQPGQCLRQPAGCGGFAIGSRDRQHAQAIAGTLVVGIGHQSCALLESGQGSQTVSHRQRLPGFTAFVLHQTGSSALFKRAGHVLAAIGGSARPCDESVTGPHLTAVRAQFARHALAQPLGRLNRGLELDHQNDSSTALTTTCGLTDMSGCTPSRRRVCCTVVLNTGAATSPPK